MERTFVDRRLIGGTLGVCAVLFLLIVYLAYSVFSLGEELKTTTMKLNSTQSQLNLTQEENLKLTGKLKEKEVELNKTKGILYDTSSQLNQTKSTLQKKETELANAKSQLAEATSNIAEIKKEFGLLKDEVSGIEKTLNESIQWFKGNAKLPIENSLGNVLRNLWYDAFLNDLNKECIVSEGGQQVLKLACISFSMEKSLSFKYAPEDPDRLYSLKEMINKEGGDCEDYALFLKAAINTLKEKSKNDEVVVQAWKGASSSKYPIYGVLGEKIYWYIPDAAPTNLDILKNIHPYVVCYVVSALEGHCIVALSKDRINTSSDLYKLDFAQTFEPQNGMYMGTIGINLHLCSKGETNCDKKAGSVIFVIGDEDLYQFSGKRWTSYKLYNETTASLREEIDSALNKKW